jgi:hypothetical protein
MPKKHYSRLSLLILVMSLLRAHARGNELGADSPSQPTPEAIELSVAPAAEPRPALKYHLLSWLTERTPGNAAPYYFRALLLLKQEQNDYWQKYNDNSDAWLTRDAQKFPAKDVGEWLASQTSALTQIRVATNREYCDWDYRVQDLRGTDTISFLLPDVQQMRQLGRVIQLQAHYEIMQGHVDEAFSTLRLGYQLAHDVGKTPLIINKLVGVAIAGIMNRELPLLIQQSQSNYYWAIRSLPDPLVDMRPALQYEMSLPGQLFPFLKDAETAERTAEEWRRLVVDALANLGNLEAGGSARKGWEGEAGATAMMIKLYPVAKEALIARGMSRDVVEMMPVAQVVAIHTARATQYAYQEIFKLALLPYDEATRRLPDVMHVLQKDILRPDAALSGAAGIPIASILLPSVHSILHAQARSVRDMAALTTIEALRMHAAGPAGTFPRSLDEVKIVPIPMNPTTGQPFPYKFDADSGVGTLDVPAVTAPQDGKRFLLRFKK